MKHVTESEISDGEPQANQGFVKGKDVKQEINEKDYEPGARYPYSSNKKGHSQGVHFSGDSDDLTVILALRSESFNNKVMFSTFIEKLKHHVLTSFTDARDMMPILEKLEDPRAEIVKNQPIDLEGEAKDSPVAVAQKTEEVKRHMKRLTNLDANKEALYGLIWQQCSNGVRELVKAEKDFSKKDSDFDTIWLLERVKLISAGVDGRSNKHAILIKSLTSLCNIKQGANESNDSFRKRIDAYALTLSLTNGEHVMCSPDLMVTQDKDKPTKAKKEAESEKFKAMLMILRADPGRFGALQESLFEGVYKGRDEFPKSVTEAYDLLQHIASDISSYTRNTRFGSRFRFRRGNRVSNVSFMQKSGKELVPGTDGKTHNITCHSCNKPGHYANKCPSNKRHTTLAHFTLTQQQLEVINKNWILLDSCSTLSVVCNPSLVTSIKPCEPGNSITVITNGGAQTFEKQAMLKALPLPVYFNPYSLANILSLSHVANLPGAKITMDSTVERAINLHFNDTVMQFNECADGFYYFDVSSSSSSKSKAVLPFYSSFIQTVHRNKEFFTKKEIAGADKSRVFQERIAWPSDKEYNTIISNNELHNTELSTDDIARAKQVYGPAPPLMLGTKTRVNPFSPNIKRVNIPLPILQAHPTLDLYVDFLYVNKLPFLHMKSGKINFLSIQSGHNRSYTAIKKGFDTVINICNKRGFEIANIHADNEFDIDRLREHLRPAALHIHGKGEHVGVIERSIRSVKERSRSVCHGLPFRRYTKLMTHSLVEYVIYWMNSFPSRDGSSNSISPAGIVLGRPPPNAKYKMIAFGAYVMVYTNTQNNMKARTIPAIALKPSNYWGGYYFMSLLSGKRIHAYDWVEAPINTEITNRVHELAKSEDQPELVDGYPIFEWSIGEPIIDDTVEQVEILDEDEGIELPTINEHRTHKENETSDSEHPTMEDDEELSIDEDEEGSQSQDLFDEPITESDRSGVKIDNEDNISFESLDNAIREAERQLEVELREIDNLNENRVTAEDNLIETEMEETPGAHIMSTDNTLPKETQNTTDETATIMPANNSGEENTTDRRPVRRRQEPTRLFMDPSGKSYLSFKHRTMLQRKIRQKELERSKRKVAITLLSRKIGRCRDKQFFQRAVNMIFVSAQMSATKGIREFGERAIAAMIKEFQQLDQGAFPGKPVVEPIDPESMTDEERMEAVEAVSLIKEKRTGEMKGRTCMNCSKQRQFLGSFESVASPTISLEALIASLIIDAHEGRCIAVFDVPGAYLHAAMPEGKRVVMKLRGQFVDLMCEANDKYKPYVRVVNGKKILYLRVLRALYGGIQSALLWYDLFTSKLGKMGFQINPYDKCVANKVINDKQCTIAWYVDDVKVSHADKEVVKDVIRQIEEEFGEMKVTYGNQQEYLGMKLYITDDRNLVIDMKDQINEVLDGFSKELGKDVVTPAARHLMEVNPNAVALDQHKKELFHSTVAKLLYIEKRARPDNETAIAFLTTRVSKPDSDDWKKLIRVLNYLRSTIDELRIIGCNRLDHLYTWVDAAYAVHYNMRSHTGGTMSFGTGILHSKSSKQKLNTKSSTEAELVGVSDYIPYNIWLRNFLKEQGYILSKNTLLQDNQSAMKMQINGRNSCTGNSRHVDIRYFFVKDRIDKKELEVEYCPTESMLADFFTKPLQGTLFKRFRDVILGKAHISTLKQVSHVEMKERVEFHDKNHEELISKCDPSLKESKPNTCNIDSQRKVKFKPHNEIIPTPTYAEVTRRGLGDNKTNDKIVSKSNITSEPTTVSNST